MAKIADKYARVPNWALGRAVHAVSLKAKWKFLSEKKRILRICIYRLGAQHPLQVPLPSFRTLPQLCAKVRRARLKKHESMKVVVFLARAAAHMILHKVRNKQNFTKITRSNQLT